MEDANVGTLAAFNLAEVAAARQAAGEPWHEFFRVPALSMGLYVLAAGAEDGQSPHGQDEIYYVVSGRGVLRVEDRDQPVGPGSILYVAAHAAHHFHAIEEELMLLVFFAPAYADR